MTELAPAAQAVRSAYHEICEDYIETWLNFNHNRGLAAALRAAADQVAPQSEIAPQRNLEDGRESMMWGMGYQTQVIRHSILAIADELEAQ